VRSAAENDVLWVMTQGGAKGRVSERGTTAGIVGINIFDIGEGHSGCIEREILPAGFVLHPFWKWELVPTLA